MSIAATIRTTKKIPVALKRKWLRRNWITTLPGPNPDKKVATGLVIRQSVTISSISARASPAVIGD